MNRQYITIRDFNMPGLTKVNDCRFASDKGQAQRSAREQLKFIMANREKLLRIFNGRKLMMTADGFNEFKEPFTDNQLSYIDAIYERTMKACGFDSFTPTYKPSRKRFN
jgi:hypothetical protein